MSSVVTESLQKAEPEAGNVTHVCREAQRPGPRGSQLVAGPGCGHCQPNPTRRSLRTHPPSAPALRPPLEAQNGRDLQPSIPLRCAPPPVSKGARSLGPAPHFRSHRVSRYRDSSSPPPTAPEGGARRCPAGDSPWLVSGTRALRPARFPAARTRQLRRT